MHRYKQDALDGLTGNWGTAILVSLVTALLTGGIADATAQLNISSENIRRVLSSVPVLGYMLVSLLTVTGLFAGALTLARLILGGVLELGSARYHLNLIDRQEARFGDLPSQFPRFVDGLVMNLLRSLFVALWTVLFVIPGIVAGFSYAMAPYILMEDPRCTGLDALRRSKAMMRGHRMSLLMLELSFIGWHILCLLTFGIGYLWLNPYRETARASFYRSISGANAHATYAEF